MVRAESIAFWLVLALALLSLAYVLACLVAIWRWRARTALAPGSSFPPVTVLKPLCGAEPELDANLCSFCEQTYPTFQLVLGARSNDDPALTIARRVAAAFSEHDIVITSGERVLGANRKVNVLAELLPHARYDVLVIADSDIRVGPDYLQHVVAALEGPSVGLVTSLYRGAPTDGLWSQLGALAIDEWFLPSVLIARALGSGAYCSGATMALRRSVLDAIGGLDALAPVLADDYELGARVASLGLRTAISRHEVVTTVHEPGFRALVSHELRWMRTIRTAQPGGHAFLFVTYALPMTLVPLLFAERHPWVIALPLVALAVRAALHYLVQSPARVPSLGPPAAVGRRSRDPRSSWLLPIRDLLSFGVWAASFTGRRVTWRELVMQVRPDGVLLGGKEERPA